MVWRGGLSLPSTELFSPGPQPSKPPEASSKGVVVPLGGGKDSLVTCSLLHQAGIGFKTIAVGRSPLIIAMGQALHAQGLSQGHIQIQRSLDPSLLALNQAGALNGHVPITAVLAGVMLVASVLYGFDTIVMSNERSADAANLYFPDGEAVNHQFSKSAAFENAFQGAVSAEVLSRFRYFSLLRDCSEIAIARHFARLEPWFNVFSSCNQNFRQDGRSPAGRWCANCPKCRFVFLALAPYLGPPALLEIFGRNLLEDPAQLQGYRDLCGLAEHKPFECVGEVEESAALMKALGAQPPWRDLAVVSALAPLVDSAAELAAFDHDKTASTIPAEFAKALAWL